MRQWIEILPENEFLLSISNNGSYRKINFCLLDFVNVILKRPMRSVHVSASKMVVAFFKLVVVELGSVSSGVCCHASQNNAHVKKWVHNTQHPRWRRKVLKIDFSHCEHSYRLNLEEERRVTENHSVGLSFYVQLDETNVHRHDQVSSGRVSNHHNLLSGPAWNWWLAYMFSKT